MADRIIAALEYLDAHTSLVLQKQKHRSLGDIDAKYDVVDPSDLPLNTIMDNRILLAGTSRTNLSREKTIDEILDEDREKILRTAQRTKSAASFHKATSHSRPSTSFSGGGVLNNENRRRSFRPLSQAASLANSRTSMKKLTFTPPGVNVGPSDARDEVMEEIANKPLTHSPTKVRNLPTRARTAQSAPALGQQSRLSVGCRSLTSMQRSKTSHSGSKRSESSQNKYETKPGPFTTVKVSDSDMWVVSDSTPISFFDEDLSSRPMSHAMISSSKPGSWEETTNSVPREEKKSPPRHQRQLGAPPQFGASQQWYSFAGNDPVKQRPILTAFADEADNEYYSIESRVSGRVASLLQASPGIRIGVNGEVVSKTMKVHQKAKVNGSLQSSLQDSDEEEKTNTQTDNPENTNEKEELASLKSDASEGQSRNSSANSGGSDAEGSNKPILEEEENRQYSLLRYLGVARGENPYVAGSVSETTSSGADVTSLLNNLRRGSKSSNGNGRNYNENEEAVWKLLEGASPSLWMNKNQWFKMRENRAKRKAKYLAAHAEEDRGPLSWKDQLDHTEKHVIEATTKPNTNDKNKEKGNTVPVVFHKFVNYDQLPENFVHLTANGYRPHSSVSAVDKNLNVGPPSKGYQSTVVTSPRATKSVTTGGDSSTNTSDFSPRPFTSPSRFKSEAKINLEEQELDVADIMRVTNGSLNKLSKESKPEELSEEELQAVRLEAAYQMKMTGRAVDASDIVVKQSERESKFNPDTSSEKVGVETMNKKRIVEKSVTLNSLPMKTDSTFATVDIRPSKPKSSIPVGTINLSEIAVDQHHAVSEQPHDRLNHPIESPQQDIALNGMRAAPEAPLNTPKTPHSFPVYFPQANEPRSPRNNFRIPSSSSHPAHSETSSHRPAPFKRASKSASFGSRSPGISPRGNLNQPSSDLNLPRQLPSRTSGGFMSSPLTGRPAHKRNDRMASGVGKSFKNLPHNIPSIIPYGNTYSDVITKSGFIQISHSLQIPSQRTSSAGNGPGNKIYDSYMRELSSRSAGAHTESNFAVEKSGGVFGKSLGGTSGKAFPEQLRHAKHYSTTPSKVKSNYPNFSVQGGRRSGLAITNDQSRQETEGVGLINTPLELQGDQVRLNLDKNIHTIYRDLGIPKKNRKSSVPSSPLLSKSTSFDKGEAAMSSKREIRSAGKSDGTRSHPHSAKSEKRASSATSLQHAPGSSVVSIPTASSHPANDSVETNQIFSNTLGGNEHIAIGHPQEKNTQLASDRNVDILMSQKGEEVAICLPCEDTQQSFAKLTASKISPDDLVDSGTQWSPHDPSPRKADHANKLDIKSSELVLAPAEIEMKTDPAEVNESTETITIVTETPGAENTNFVASTSTVTSHDAVSAAATQETRSEEEESTKSVVEHQQSGNGELKESADANIENQETPVGLLGKRSASDSKLHLVEKDAADAESAMADEEVDIRGVTKVTVNIGSLPNA